MQGAGKTAPRLIATCSDVVEEVPARRHRLFQARSCVAELILRLLVLPQESGGHPEQTQDPEIVGRESVRRVVDGHRSDPALAGSPRYRDRILDVVQSCVAPHRVQLGGGSLQKRELVLEDEELDHPLAPRAEREPDVVNGRLVSEAIGRRLEPEGSSCPKSPEGCAASTSLHSDRRAKATEEGRQVLV